MSVVSAHIGVHINKYLNARIQQKDRVTMMCDPASFLLPPLVSNRKDGGGAGFSVLHVLLWVAAIFLHIFYYVQYNTEVKSLLPTEHWSNTFTITDSVLFAFSFFCILIEILRENYNGGGQGGGLCQFYSFCIPGCLTAAVFFETFSFLNLIMIDIVQATVNDFIVLSWRFMLSLVAKLLLIRLLHRTIDTMNQKTDQLNQVPSGDHS